MYFLKRLLTWWNSQTIGTQIWTARHGVKVGEDDQGNIYYQTADAKRRWVIYNGESEASRVSPDWHGWLHFTWDQPPTEGAAEAQGLGKAASGKPDRHRRGLCADRLDPRARPRWRAAIMRPGSPNNGRESRRSPGRGGGSGRRHRLSGLCRGGKRSGRRRPAPIR